MYIYVPDPSSPGPPPPPPPPAGGGREGSATAPPLPHPHPPLGVGGRGQRSWDLRGSSAQLSNEDTDAQAEAALSLRMCLDGFSTGWLVFFTSPTFGQRVTWFGGEGMKSMNFYQKL